MATKKQMDLTQGKVWGPLMAFAMPVLLALLLQAMYGAADLMVVGLFAAPGDVSAVATGSQVMQTLTSLITGLAMGTTVLLGRYIGEKQPEKAAKTAGASICLFAMVAAALTILFTALTEPIATLMHAPAEAFEQTVHYIRTCAAGTVFIVAYNLLGSLFRGIGDSRMPLITVAIACLFNIAGDLLLVAVCGLGSLGAALATVLAQALSVAISLLIIRKRKLPFAFGARDIRFDRRIMGNVLWLGLPIALQDVLVGLSFLVVMTIVNSLGLIASAGVGVAEKLCGFIMLVPSSFMQSMSAFVAQNMGAGKPERARKALTAGIVTSFAFGLVMAWLSFFHGRLLAGIFASDPQIIAAAADYLRAYAVDCLLVCFLFCIIGYLNGAGQTGMVLIQGIAGAFLVRVPVSYLMSRLAPVSLFRVGLATPCSTLVQILLCGAYFLRLSHKEKATAALKGHSI